jgi:hypothetical protein
VTQGTIRYPRMIARAPLAPWGAPFPELLLGQVNRCQIREAPSPLDAHSVPVFFVWTRSDG